MEIALLANKTWLPPNKREKVALPVSHVFGDHTAVTNAVPCPCHDPNVYPTPKPCGCHGLLAHVEAVPAVAVFPMCDRYFLQVHEREVHSFHPFCQGDAFRDAWVGGTSRRRHLRRHAGAGDRVQCIWNGLEFTPGLT